MEKSQIAIIGAGLGGLVTAHLLLQAGYEVSVYEQASHFSRLGAGIQLGPNVLKILRRIRLEAEVEAMGSHPASWVSRNWDDAAILADVALNRRKDEFGASYVTVHRGDFHMLLANRLPDGVVRFGKKLQDIEASAASVAMRFADGSTAQAALLIGADGVNSRVRELLLGPEEPIYSGYVGHRAIFPAAALRERGVTMDACAKWWSDDRHFVVYYLDHAQEEAYYVTGVPQARWSEGVSFVESSQAEMRHAFAGYHPDVQAIIDAAPTVVKWPLLTRHPLPLWSSGRMVLLGDASHPMKPHMAQGAAMAIEDGAMLARCFDHVGSLDRHAEVFRLYEANRKGRASRVQEVSNANTWLRTNENPDWVYGYDVFTAPLAALDEA